MATFWHLNHSMKKARALHLQGSSLQGSFQMRCNFSLNGSFGMHSRTRVNDDDRSPAAEATHSELGVNTIARCRPVQFDGMAVNAKPVPGERLPDNFQLSGPHRPGDNFHLSVPLSNAFLERSTFHGRQQSWPKLQCLRAHFAKTTPTGRS